MLLGLGLGTLHAAAADSYFNNGSRNQLYRDGGNWSPTGVPDLTTANTAHIDDDSAVQYDAGPDLTIRDGGVLEITKGSFTQINGPAYTQLAGTGTILIDGGTFNQGSASSGPFNVSGTGNVFNMTSGTANFNRGFSVATGLTSTLSGGTLTTTGGGTNVSASLTLSGANAALGDLVLVNSTGVLALSRGNITANGSVTNAGTFTVSGGQFTAGGDVTNSGTLAIASATLSVGRVTNTGAFSMCSGTLTTSGEFDFNNAQNTLSGGTINTTLITGVNGSGTRVFNISGGVLTLSNSFGGGIYNGGTDRYINFTENSTGSIDFKSTTGNDEASIRRFLSSNAIEYNNTPYNSTTDAQFQVTSDGSGGFTLSLANVAVPEPATCAAGALLTAFAAPAMARRLRRRSA